MVRRLFVHSYLKRVTVYLLLVTALLIPTFGAYGIFNLDTEILPSEKRDYIINSINLHDDINDMSDNCLSSAVVSFDVSENGMVVLGLRGNEIAVLDRDSNTYSATNGLKIMNAIAPSRIKIIKTDADLNVTTVYKAKNSYTTAVISTAVVIVMFAVVCFVFSKNKNDGESSLETIKAKKIESVWFVILPAFLIADRLQSAYFIKHGQTNTSIAISAVCYVVLIAGGLVSLYFYVKNKNGNDDGH